MVAVQAGCCHRYRCPYSGKIYKFVNIVTILHPGGGVTHGKSSTKTSLLVLAKIPRGLCNTSAGLFSIDLALRITFTQISPGTVLSPYL